ncbi:MAG TPA: maleylpyruvate isomerase family mycothiol-dependent enzyme [Ilumatobacteraceae bacterium]|nr:maleylpyruvate isomerase family mycothiol-dependent enzyme [Ilumatobacteraceae bacterium]
MEKTDFIAALERDSAAFVDACEVAGLTSTVASCPGWTVADLLWHLTEVHDFWCTIVSQQMSDPKQYKEPMRPVDESLAEMYRHGREELLTTLAGTDPSTPVWTWSADHTAGFVIRRMAQETAVHLWDATEAADLVNPMEPVLASDGIDEFLTHMLGDAVKDAEPVGGSVHLHCGDVAGEWTVREQDDGFAVAREHSKGDCAIRGSASDILLSLWRRVPLAQCDVVGDADVAARFIAHTNLD